MAGAAAPIVAFPTIRFIDKNLLFKEIMKELLAANSGILKTNTSPELYQFAYDDDSSDIRSKIDDTYSIFVYPANSSGIFGSGISDVYKEMFPQIQQKLTAGLKAHFKGDGTFSVGSAILIPIEEAKLKYLLAAPTMTNGGTNLRTEKTKHNIYLAMVGILILLRNFRQSTAGKSIMTVYIPALGMGVGQLPLIDCAIQIYKALAFIKLNPPFGQSENISYFMDSEHDGKQIKQILHAFGQINCIITDKVKEINIQNIQNIQTTSSNNLSNNVDSNNNQNSSRAQPQQLTQQTTHTVYFKEIIGCLIPEHRGQTCYQVYYDIPPPP